MRTRVVLGVVVLGLAVATVTLARQQAGDAPKQNQEQRNGPAQPGAGAAPALLAQVAKIRAEVELLELEHEVDRAFLLDMLKAQRHPDSATEQTAKVREEISKTMIMAASIGQLDEIKKRFGDEKAMQSQAEKELKEGAERDRADCDREKKAFVRQTTELNEKRLALGELEKQLANVK